jgi:sulfonate transport system permease protein
MSVEVQASTGATDEQLRSVATPGGGYSKRSKGSMALASWSWLWPKLVALAIVLLVWEYLYWTEWRPHFVLPSPRTVGSTLWDQLTHGRIWSSVRTTMWRAVKGYAVALLIGSLIGIAVVQWKVFRRGVGSLVAAMQTMPSIAWFPLAILLFGATEKAILFVVVLGAAPSIASGLITGIDEVPPPLLRAGKMLGARGVNRYRYVVVPAAMPAYVQGMKQGWAFSWRSLLAGELLVNFAGTTSVGSDLNLARETFHPDLVLTLMIIILVIGIIVDTLFGLLTKQIRNRRGLTGAI